MRIYKMYTIGQKDFSLQCTKVCYLKQRRVIMHNSITRNIGIYLFKGPRKLYSQEKCTKTM